MIEPLEKQVKKRFGSWIAFAKHLEKSTPNNFKRTFFQNLEKFNNWLEPLGLEIQIVLKKQKRVGKNIKTDK